MQSAEQQCAPPSPESNDSKTVGLAKAVQDLECLSLKDFTALHCSVLEQLSFQETDAALSNLATLKEITEPQQALQFLEEGQPGVITLPSVAIWESPFHEARDAVLRDLNVKAKASNYRAKDWQRAFEISLITNCELGEQYKSTVDAFDAVAEQKKRIHSLAQKAWAPDGFAIDEESGVAFKELEKGCGWGYCLNYEIVSQNWCASLKARLSNFSPLIYESQGKRNVEAGQRITVQLNSEYDLSKLNYEVEFFCLGS